MEQKFFQKPNTFVGQVEIKVQNLARSITFYKKTIGFQVMEQTEKSAVLSPDGKTALLILVEPENSKPKEAHTTGLYHFAILLPSRLELAKVLRHFAEINQQLGASDHLVSEALYLSDPDGNGIEIYADRPSATWKWQNDEVMMAVDPLDAQSILAELGDEKWEGLPAGTVMGHIHLHVSELEKTEAFYKGLGFQKVSHLGNQALFISTGNYHHHIGLNTWAGAGAPAPSENSAGLHSFSLVFPNEKARERAVGQVEELGYEVQKEDGIFVTNDPSENTIKLSL